jgi:hypothetical protein
MKKYLYWTILTAGLLAPTSPMQAEVGAAATGDTGPTDATVPEQFRPLYRELDDALRHAAQNFPFQKNDSRPVVAPSLFMAGSGYGPAAPDSQRWHDLLDTLDAFKAAGMSGVSVMIAAPDLSLGDPGPLLGFYQRLAAAVHARAMKLYVEHFDNPPFSPHALKGLPDTPQGRKDFLALREKELALIYREIKPDYLSILTEPETMMRWSHLSFSADELASWVGDVATRLKSTGASPSTLLGAGAGTWEPEAVILGIARQRSVDYVDMHLYALSKNGEDLADLFATRVGKVRAIRPDLKITIGEMWLYKHGAAEPKGMLSREAFARDNFSFWSPLDQQFLALTLGLAQKENVAAIAPYFSQYLFTYYTYGDSDSNKLPPWPMSVPVTWIRALEAIHAHRLSPTGEAFRMMLQLDRK